MINMMAPERIEKLDQFGLLHKEIGENISDSQENISSVDDTFYLYSSNTNRNPE